MRRTLVTFAILTASVASVAAQPPLPTDGKVHGTVTTTAYTPECSGDPGSNPDVPPKVEPAVKRLLFRRGKVNSDVKPAVEVTTTDGTFAVKLPPGTWCIVDDSKRKVAHGDPGKKARDFDLKCLLAKRRQCEYVVVVRAGKPTLPVLIDYPTGTCSWASPECSKHITSPPP